MRSPEFLDRAAGHLIVLVLSLFLVIEILGSQVFESYRIDVQRNHDHCHSQNKTEEYPDSKDCQSFLYKTADDPVALFTGGLFIFTMALAIFTLRLVKITKAGIKEQAELTRASLEHAARSADTAVTALQNERAWMCFSECRITAQFKSYTNAEGHFNDEGIAFQITLKNQGKIPARLVPLITNAAKRLRSNTDIPVFPKTETSNTVAAILLGPESTVGGAPVYLIGHDFREWKKANIRLFMYVFVWYKPRVNVEELVYTEACLEIVFIGESETPNPNERIIQIACAPVGNQNTAS